MSTPPAALPVPAPASTLAELLALLQPILARVATLDPGSRTAAAAQETLVAALEDAFPSDGPLVQAIGASLEAGVAGGWLCDRGEPEARFSRVAKPSPTTHGLSIDVVRLQGAGVRHRHPQGEVTLGFAVAGEPRFCDAPPGWIFAAPGSVHIPRVTGGTMNLIYFLPAGAVEWDPS